ncbi:hypothetical protein R70199_06988 [Paraburkholderia domus]|nr:hypothetical protein R70199_06988 [Paraburkholderia domus]
MPEKVWGLDVPDCCPVIEPTDTLEANGRADFAERRALAEEIAAARYLDAKWQKVPPMSGESGPKWHAIYSGHREKRKLSPRPFLNCETKARGEFRRPLEYKLDWSDGWLFAIPPQKMSRACPCCGHQSGLSEAGTHRRDCATQRIAP